MPFIDLNLGVPMSHTSVTTRKEMADEPGENTFFAIDGFFADLRISPVRRALRRQLQDQEFFLLGSVSLHGFCPTYIQGEFARYSGLPASGADQIISYEHPRQSVPQHVGSRKRGSLFEKTPILQALSNTEQQETVDEARNQLNLFN